ncbi:DUF456 domain-containing protein [Motilibacter aurantiacus]|uniref:DUF456 domain-containing protein n=1 Tax=Motilibacter aurantiacus TaxID=2714955 RepID=UPI001408A027|nr:DUF456 domain-containing protein [Motilibacter aurantiacus]NHC46228.1 DUF456 domain-containing protein [Motilibacter aurantiacus]
MELWELALVALAMLVGLVGVLVPVLPGLAVIWAAGLVWAWLEDGVAPWLVLAAVTAVLGAGTTAKYVLPARALRGSGAPTSTVLAGAALGVVGFFVLPVVGLPLGFVGGVYLAEQARLRAPRAAWASTVVTLKGIGIGVLLELAAGLVAVGLWTVSALIIAA